MDKHIAQALNSLVPTITGPLPPELLELAASLLAQSRSKAGSLKAEEEIARSYACANIACERLKQNLALPRIEPRPPCPPRVYQKLYKYLDDAMPTSIRKSSRSFKTFGTLTRNSSKHIRPDKPAQPINSRRKSAGRAISDIKIPPWVMPTIRHLCTKLSAPAVAPHIFAGVSSILVSDNQPENINIPALIVTTYILILNALTGTETEPAEYLRRRETARAAVQEALAQRALEMECSQANVDDCMRQVNKFGWTGMDWFENLEGRPALNGRDYGEESGRADDAESQEGHSLPVHSKSRVSVDLEEDYLQAGLGTMMDDRIDYLSNTRKRSFERWKTETLLHIDELESREWEMNVDAG